MRSRIKFLSFLLSAAVLGLTVELATHTSSVEAGTRRVCVGGLCREIYVPDVNVPGINDIRREIQNCFSGGCDPGRLIDIGIPVEEIWGEAGRGAYRAAAEWMRTNNSSGRSLDNFQKRYLRPHFGDLVDRVRVTYNANLLDEWSAFGYKISQGSGAQAYCDQIYVNDSYRSSDTNQLVLLAHELIHSQQCQRHGGYYGFGYHYFKEYKKANQNYRNNKLEQEAFTFEDQFAGWIGVQVAVGGILSDYHSGCNSLGKSRSPDCVAAIHRYCDKNSRGGAGLSQEVGAGVFGVACFNPTWYGDVSVNTLRSYHQGCDNLGKSQAPECVAAIHRYCFEKHGAGAGLSQEVGAGVFGVACFNPTWYGDVSVNTLRSYHQGCDNLGKSQAPECVAAMHRYCFEKRGAGAGLSQEVGAGVFGVACFNPTWYGDVAPVLRR
ncbi:MAG: hypothetical protein F6K50_37455 [Moorea sp. SIO3I7]|uniref:hypothetical protein n=1 Tax=unclassified Moorena TaxID=2683338 RepID=UPI0013C02D68|nr:MULTISPECIES: hypothetical protein [unclassified Moorena]NEO00909.1 hypothetical protein [Moorena sp. SIO3I7]NEO09418.1 hypothetical protein [Moorena sp. SIO3I8]NEO19479.1 hypothetical protein [Moorena sp. SIO4A5]NEP26237.1 hypothetical protein [Moorena sp. SIO3I6]NEQ62018.1 hypothetical protein [Moorena sp. SIO4A1]